METFLQDLRYGLRVLARNPGFAAIAVLTLALGIGANTAIFSIVDAVLLRSVPYQESNRLVWISSINPHFNNLSESSGPDYLDWKRQADIFDSVAAFQARKFTLTGQSQAEEIMGSSVSSDFLRVMRVAPMLGRDFLPEEHQAGKNQAVLLGYGFWQQRFGGDRAAIGKTIDIGLSPYTIVGVLPPGFDYPFEAQLWTPLHVEDTADARGSFYIHVIGRLRTSIAIRAAQARLDAMALRFQQQYPETHAGVYASAVSLKKHIVGNFQLALTILQAAVGLVLLIACVNVANLLLARTASRQREIAIRASLGASRFRVARQLLTESVMLSVAGGALGFLLAIWSLGVLVHLAPDDIPGLQNVGINSAVFSFSLLVSLATGILFGLAPAWEAAKSDLGESLKEGGGTFAGGRRHQRVRGLLVVSEIALALVLSIGGGLLFKSFLRLQSVEPGFAPDHLIGFYLSLPKVKYPQEAQQTRFYQNALQQLAALPGVSSAAAVSPLPFSGGWGTASFSIEGRPKPKLGEEPSADYFVVSPDYFQTMRIPLIAGRYFDQRDDEKAPRAAVIDEQMARTFWPNENPIGKRFDQQGLVTVIGVVGHVKMISLADDPKPEFYFNNAQVVAASTAIVLRTATDPAILMQTVRRQISALDSDLPIVRMETMDERLAASVAEPRFRTLLLGVFAGLAVLLATVGIYGVISYTVAQRTHEIGIRVALGAAQRDIFRLVLGKGMSLTFAGIAVGFAASAVVTRFLSGLLFGVKPLDLITFVGIAIVLGSVALLACYLPARRATRVDPLVALRYE